MGLLKPQVDAMEVNYVVRTTGARPLLIQLGPDGSWPSVLTFAGRLLSRTSHVDRHQNHITTSLIGDRQ